MVEQCFFPEPSSPDETYARRGESIVNWLERSTVPRAREARRFLNEHLARLPSCDRQRISHSLRDRWPSAFFELVLIRLFQEMGATVKIEPLGTGGRRPDLEVRFPDGTVIVEATVPIINAQVGTKGREHVPLLDYIESVSEGWLVNVGNLPSIGPGDSQREFKREVAKEFDALGPEGDAWPKRVYVCLQSGVVSLYISPAEGSQGGIVSEPLISAFDNTKQRIQHSVKAKRGQVRGASAPALLAVQAPGFGSSLRDFDIALFGRTVDERDQYVILLKTRFDANGEFARGEGEPTFAGLLAFLHVSYMRIDMPVLYRHPGFTCHLPEALLLLEQRYYDSEKNSIRVVESQVPKLIDRLNLAKA